MQPASRFFAGAGIYRHVWLISEAGVHIEDNGLYVSTSQVSADSAMVHVETTVTNGSAAESRGSVKTMVYRPNGTSPGIGFSQFTIAAGGEATVTNDIPVMQPQLWDLDSPTLYMASSEVSVRADNAAGPQLVDEQTVSFGIRDAKFVPDTGFWLNGKNFKLKGVCVHQDGGAFGVAVPMSVWERRLIGLKALGVNAIRTAHNPPAPEFLDLCDRLGLVVMDEMFDCWLVGKNSLDGQRLQDYHLYFADWAETDTRDTVRRDRNHPSIVLFSAGNEIHDTPNAASAKRILSGLVAVFHANDPGVPVTQALFRPNASHDYMDGLADLLDVVGQNYRENEIMAAHEQVPTRKIVGTENGTTRQTWVAMRDHAAYAGQFLWTGVDYLGESRSWPNIGHGSGLLDRTGEARPVAYERQSWWSDKPMVYIVRRTGNTDRLPQDPGTGPAERYRQVVFSDWTVRTPSPRGESVEIYSNCREVELFLNGQSLGSKELPRDASPRVWNVPYAAGTLRAEGKNGAGVVAMYELKTAGAPARIVLSNDRPQLAQTWDDVALVRATIVDAQGVPARSNALITFATAGPGAIAAVDNTENNAATGDGANGGIVSFQSPKRHAAEGTVTAFVRATASAGQIMVTASAPGLQGDSVTFQAQP